MTRDRVQTEQRLIDAVHELITEEGFEQLRINRLAQRAKVNKVLIYRYFGGIDGLMTAYYAKYKPVVNATPIDYVGLRGAPVNEFFDACCDYLLEEFRLLRANPQAQRFLKNDLMAYQPGIINPIAVEKEAQLREMVDELAKLIDSDMGRPFTAIVISGMTLLTFLGQDKRTVMGIDLGTDEGWNEIEETLRRVYYSLSVSTRNRIGDFVLTPPPPSDDQEPS